MKSELILILFLSIAGATWWMVNSIDTTKYLEAENERLHYELELEKVKSNAYEHGVKDAN